MFNPNQYRNQHYVPVFWQRRFAGTDGVLWGLENGTVRPISADSVEAPPRQYFLLGDTPFPPGMLTGFTLPVSSSLALIWQPGGTEMLTDWSRRLATELEVNQSNRQQIDNALKVAIGPTKAALEKYGTT